MDMHARIALELARIAKSLVAEDQLPNMKNYTFCDFAVSRRDRSTAFVYAGAPYWKIENRNGSVVISRYGAALSKEINDAVKSKDTRSAIYSEAIIVHLARHGQRKTYEQSPQRIRLQCAQDACMSLLMKNPAALDQYISSTCTTTPDEAYRMLAVDAGLHRQAVASFLGVQSQAERSFKRGGLTIEADTLDEAAVDEFARRLSSSGVPADLLYGNIQLAASIQSHDGGFIAEGDYDRESDSLRILEAMSMDDIVGTAVHETGHRWRYKKATPAQLDKFRRLYAAASDGAPGYAFPTQYSRTSSDEFIGDCFREYFLGNRDQASRNIWDAFEEIVLGKTKPAPQPEQEDDMDSDEIQRRRLGTPVNLIDLLSMPLGDVTFIDVWNNTRETISLPVRMTEKGYRKMNHDFSIFFRHINTVLSNDRKKVYYNITSQDEKSDSTTDISGRKRSQMGHLLAFIRKERESGATDSIQTEDEYQKRRYSNPSAVFKWILKSYLLDDYNYGPQKTYTFIKNAFTHAFEKEGIGKDYFKSCQNIDDMLKKGTAVVDRQNDRGMMAKMLATGIAESISTSNAIQEMYIKFKLSGNEVEQVVGMLAQYLGDKMAESNELKNAYIDAFRNVTHLFV